MSLKKIILSTSALIMAAGLFLTCSTTNEITHGEYVEEIEPPPLLTQMPVIEYSGKGIKYEFESMLLYQFVVFSDKTASGGFATRLLDESSSAQLKVKFPAGTYECLVSEKSNSSSNAAFYIYVDGIPHRVFPSDPPLGTWELTTRAPVYFTIEEPRTVLITVQANSEHKLGHTGMNLDFIQFVKRN